MWKHLRLWHFNIMANGSSPGAVNDAINTTNIKPAVAGRDMALGDIAKCGEVNWATITVPSGATKGWPWSLPRGAEDS